VIYLKHGVILGNLAGIMPLATCAVAISRLNWT
jgi:phage portal protein BeeE